MPRSRLAFPRRTPAVGARSGLCLGLFLCLLGPTAWVASAAASPQPEPEPEPRLILPGARAVQVGEAIVLRWAPADSVSELEILLSRDGGRHFDVCVSPRLDPRRCEFAWRVPELGSERLLLRIRFNRRGREIEGAPSAPLRIATAPGDGPEPLGLPPLAAGSGSGSPKPASSGARGDAPSGGSAALASVPAPAAARAAASRPGGAPLDLGARARPPRCDRGAREFANTPPRSIPLRT